MACSFHVINYKSKINTMKKIGIAFMIIGNLLHMCSGMKMKITKTVAESDDPEMSMETEREISCPEWLGIPFILAGGMMYLAGLRK